MMVGVELLEVVSDVALLMESFVIVSVLIGALSLDVEVFSNGVT